MIILWDNGVSDWLYAGLFDAFGSYAQWLKKWSPEKDDGRYNYFCAEVAKEVGAKSYRSVQQQINWAISTQPCFKSGYLSTVLRNKTYAVKNNLLTEDYLPSFVYKDSSSNTVILSYL